MVDQTKNDVFDTTRGIKLKKDKGTFSETDEKCSLKEPKYTSIYCRGFEEAIEMVKQNLGLQTNFYSGKCELIETINPDDNSKERNIVTIILDKEGKELLKDRGKVEAQQLKITADGCVIPLDMRADIMCFGFKKGFEMISKVIGLDSNAFSSNCKINIEGEDAFALMGIRKKLQQIPE